MTTVRLTGKTFDHREKLKSLGGRWDGTERNWLFEYVTPREIAELKALPGCMVIGEEVVRDWTPKPAKVDPLADTMSLIERIRAEMAEDTPQSRQGKTVFHGDDRQYYNHFKDKNPTSYIGFSSLGKFVDWIEAIPEHVKNDEKRNAGWQTGRYEEKFAGTPDMAAAINLARNGWQDGIDNANKVAQFLTAGHALQRRRAYGVAGGAVSVGRLLASNPMHMIRRPKSPGSKVITLFVQNNGLADIKSESMIVRSAICCAIVDLLESNGFSCELISVTTDYLNRTVPAEHLVVKIKSAGEKLNLPDVAFALGHPAFFRRFAFATIGQADELREQWLGMGCSTEAFNSKHQPERGEFYIPHLKENYQGDSLEEVARKMLPAIMPEGLPLELTIGE